ncbi:MAG: DUF3299 domain-containing protein [Gammaproteobacteria bacterium]
MSRSTSFACALACAFLCETTAVVAATQPAAPSAPASKQPASTSAPAAGSAKKSTAGAKAVAPKPKPKTNELQEIDWRDLLPETDRKKYNPNAPAPVHGPLGEGGPPAVQVVTTTVNSDLDQALVKLPGFIVPLGEPKDGVVREFYLVPYIGEDIHVPPPPSNQMVYVRSAAGVAAEAVHEAYWVTGKIHVETRTTPLGTSAWSLVANKVEQYQY